MQDDSHDSKPLQPPYDVPCGVSLTVAEILSLVVDLQAGMTNFTTYLDEGAEILLECSNERTGHICRMARLEWESGHEFVVELQTDLGFVMANWSSDKPNPVEDAYWLKCAEQTMLRWSALIGVLVGFGLMANPPNY